MTSVPPPPPPLRYKGKAKAPAGPAVETSPLTLQHNTNKYVDGEKNPTLALLLPTAAQHNTNSGGEDVAPIMKNGPRGSSSGGGGTSDRVQQQQQSNSQPNTNRRRVTISSAGSESPDNAMNTHPSSSTIPLPTIEITGTTSVSNGDSLLKLQIDELVRENALLSGRLALFLQSDEEIDKQMALLSTTSSSTSSSSAGGPTHRREAVSVGLPHLSREVEGKIDAGSAIQALSEYISSTSSNTRKDQQGENTTAEIGKGDARPSLDNTHTPPSSTMSSLVVALVRRIQRLEMALQLEMIARDELETTIATQYRVIAKLLANQQPQQQ